MGLGAQVFLGVDVGLALGILVGLVVANFVPSDKACAIRGKRADEAAEGGPAARP